MAVTVRRIDGSSGGDLQANCSAEDLVGHAVYVSADRIGNRYQVRKVDVDDVITPLKSVSLGIINAKTSSTECTVRTRGVLRGIYSGLTPGSRLFVGTDAMLGDTPPPHPVAGKRVSQKVGHAIASDTILVAPAEPIRMLPL